MQHPLSRSRGPHLARRLFCLFALTLLLTCLPALAADDAAKTIAKVGDQSLTLGELEALAKNQLIQVELQRQAILEGILDQWVISQVVEMEAKARNASVEDFMQSEITAKIKTVSDADIDAFYLARKIQAPKEQVVGQIRDYLKQEQGVTLQKSLFDGLRKKYPVSTMLEPIRFAIDIAETPTKGKADAPITIAEFSDFQCPGCKGVLPSLERLKKTYGDKIKIAFNQYPLRSIHPQAQKAAEASFCARDQGKFWEMHDAMFADQGQLATEGLKSTANNLGLDGEKFAQCLDSGQYAKAVQSDIDKGDSVGVGSTPSFYVNGRPVTLRGGVDPYDLIAPVIEAELSQMSGE